MFIVPQKLLEQFEQLTLEEQEQVVKHLSVRLQHAKSKKMDKYFSPRRLAKQKPQESLVHLSQTYYRIANELRGCARHPPGKWPGHYYVFPAVVMFVSCIEAFMQELLGGSRRLVENGKAKNKDDQIVYIDLLRESRRPYNDFNSWIREIFRMYDRTNGGIDTNSVVYKNIIALKELRNAVAHYNPVFLAQTQWPANLIRVLHGALPEIKNAGWVTNLSCVEVADWAHETIKDAIVLFCEKSGADCPFTSEYGEGMFRW